MRDVTSAADRGAWAGAWRCAGVAQLLDLGKIRICGMREQEASGDALDNEAVAGGSPWLWRRTRATKSRHALAAF
jgi:hypothetical protein